ncbi:MAG: SusD/RagB family nutrient-binding outer membrane lipoprotein [Chitinophagaceae bacterium]|nr:SusD/RagB family nutrient-binding outer membrane lipoprotein [Chitinophagaceae bacterium]
MMTKYIKWLTIVTVMPVLFSCSKMLENTNINKNNPSDIPLTGLLPAAEVALTYNIAADFSMRSSIFVQHIGGIGGFAVNDDKYDFATSNFDGAWANAYGKSLNNLLQIIKKAEAAGAPRYAGIAKVLTALSLGTLTDAYGDIPYTEALNPEILAPSYESQEAIYNKIQSLLESAVSDLQQTTGLAPGNDDVIFKGNIARWIASAWTLRARYALHLSARNSQQAAQQVLGFLYDGNTYRGIQHNDGDIAITFGTSNNQASPWFTQDAGRPGWYGMGGYLVDLLNGDPPAVPVDPRRAAFAAPRPAPAPPDTYVGSRPGIPTAASNIVGVNTYYGRNNSPVSLLSFPEAKLIEAEARLLLDENDPLIQASLETAVKSSFEKVTSVADPFASQQNQDEYIAKRVQLNGSAAEKLKTIITQKYVALYLNPEVWVDYRRTGYPELSPATGGATTINPNGEIPRRFSYPNSEVNLNPQLPVKSSDLQQPRLWWDQ